MDQHGCHRHNVEIHASQDYLVLFVIIFIELSSDAVSRVVHTPANAKSSPLKIQNTRFLVQNSNLNCAVWKNN